MKKDIIYNKDCILGMEKLDENSIDCCITDPPYNYEVIGRDWDKEETDRRLKRIKGNSSTLVKNIPYGNGLAGGVRNKNWYKRNQENNLQYIKWCSQWGSQVFRILKPGSYFLVFNSTRTIAHVQVAMEAVGFYARDILVWRRNSGIPKGLNIERKYAKTNSELANKWKGWHSCLRNEWEAICVLQKPLVNNYVTTIEQYGVGLIKAEFKNGFRSNIIENIKKSPVDDINFHCTVKPYNLIKYLMQLVVPKESDYIILDPFMGSGTTALACIHLGNKYIGYEINQEYYQTSLIRIREFVSLNKK